MKNKNKLYILVGPSGVGKNTLLEGLLTSMTNTKAAVSMTTRKPRAGEVHGVHYKFVDEWEFENYIDSNSLLQYVFYSGNYYGLAKDEIDYKLKKYDVFAVVEPEGVEQLKSVYPEAVSMFIRPATRKVLSDRMRARGDSTELIEKRMATYSHFMDYMPEADYILNDGKPEHVLEDAIAIINRKRNE